MKSLDSQQKINRFGSVFDPINCGGRSPCSNWGKKESNHLFLSSEVPCIIHQQLVGLKNNRVESNICWYNFNSWFVRISAGGAGAAFAEQYTVQYSSTN